MKEIWKPVHLLPTMSEFREEYLVSNFGRLRTITGRISNTSPDKNGYIRPRLTTKEGKQKLIYLHRLVALAFCEGYEEGLVVNHIDEVKHNNYFENLEWITQAENNAHGTRTERTEKPVEALDIETMDCVLVFKSTRHAEEFGFNGGNVSAACRSAYNKHCKHGGTSRYKDFLWRFA